MNVNETGAHCLAYSPRHNLLFSGGKKGDIAIVDIRSKNLLITFTAHSKTVKSLCVDDENGLLISGSTEGLVKVKI